MNNVPPMPPMPSQHVVELLPAYLNVSLDTAASILVEQHISLCESCQRELDVWRMVQHTTILTVEESMPLPSISVLNNIFAEIEREEHEQRAYSANASPSQYLLTQYSLARILAHYWQLFKMQIPILNKSIWLGSALVMALACALLLFSTPSIHTTSTLLALFTCVIGASGTAFIYGPQSDEGYELLLATPTSPRPVMFSRMVIVMIYDICLALLVSLILVVARGEQLAQLVQLWLGPLLLLSSLSLLLSLFFGSVIALCGSLALVIAQSLQFDTDGVVLTHNIWWQTNPILLLISILLVLIALMCVPKQVHLS